jgi:hypothetical protein
MKGFAGVAAIVMVVIASAVLIIQAAAASSSQPLPVAYGFEGASGWVNPAVKPHDLYFGAGGSLQVRGLRWESWTQNAAIARGVRWTDNCVPDCASGSYAKAQVELTLSRVRKHRGSDYFTRVLLQWTTGGQQHTELFRWLKGSWY